MDFFHHGALPPSPSYLASCKMLWVFLQLFMYIRALSYLSQGAPSLLPFPSSPTSFLFFSICFPPAPILADRKTSSFSRSHVVSWCSQYSQHGTQRHTDTNMLTPVQHHILQWECCWHKYKPTRAVPLWNDSGVSRMNTACKDPVYKHVSPNSSAQQNAGIAKTTPSNSCSHWLREVGGRKRERKRIVQTEK